MDVLLFPRTKPDALLIPALLSVFDGAACLCPLEADSSRIDMSCQRIVPAPLGADRSRFLHMLRDLVSHPGEYYEGFLRALSDSISVHRLETVDELIADFAPHTPATKKNNQQEALWQARLVLSLTEILEAEEAALAAGLAAVEAREQKLLASLHGETDLPDDDDMDFCMESVSTSPTISTGVGPATQCCLAWAQLFLVLEKAPWPVFAVTSPEALAWLANQYEKKTLKAPVELGELLLPKSDVIDSTAAPSLRSTLNDKARNAIAALQQVLFDTATGQETAASASDNFTNLATQWRQGLVDCGHQPGAGGTLRFFLFQDRSLNEILATALRQPMPVTPGFSQGIAVILDIPRIGINCICREGSRTAPMAK